MIYLDYAASAPPYAEVCALSAETAAKTYGNPSSIHPAGTAARRLLRESRQRFAAAMNVPPECVIFTSGGTEANNTVLMSVRNAPRRSIVLAASEHHSVLNAAMQLKKLGFSVTEILPDSRGRILPEAVSAALTRDTALLCVHAVNNETGTVQDIAAMAELAHSVGALYHCDAVQSFGHLSLPLECADFVSVSAHKFGGPRGAGALIAKQGALSAPLIFGGAQEFSLRAGTENLPAIAGMALAAEMVQAELESESVRLEELSELLVSLLREKLPVELTSGDAPRASGILSLRFPDKSAEELVTRLGEAGICISAGAACTVGSSSPSHVLTAMGFSPKEARETVRISLGRLTTEDEIRAAADAIVSLQNQVTDRHGASVSQ